MMSEELINKHRPKTFDEVVGQEAAVLSIQKVLEKKRARTFLLTGPSGVGKTTIGRLIAKAVGCASIDLVEVDGASNTSIDAMREVTSRLHYKSMSGGARVVIVDEVHLVSLQGRKSILKSIEEPPEGVYWVLCTTEADKIPKEIQTRCASYDLKPVDEAILVDYIVGIAKIEKMLIAKSKGAIGALVEAAEGSPRQALAFLSQCGELTDEGEVRQMCKSAAVATKEAIDLCRLLIKGSDWGSLTKCIATLTSPPESTRVVILRYMATIAIKERNPGRAMAIIDAFSAPFQDREGNAPLLLACANLLAD